jgi:hypothetical protein
MNIDEAPKACKHCGLAVEQATSTDNTTIDSDSCYGCRMRWTQAHMALLDAETDLIAAEKLLADAPIEDTAARNVSDEIGQRVHQVRGTWRLIAAHLYGPNE